MTYRVSMTREIGGKALRTTSVTGEADMLPTVGRPFVLIGESLTPGGTARLVNTSPVRDVTNAGDGVYLLTTASGSTYRVTVLSTNTPEEN